MRSSVILTVHQQELLGLLSRERDLCDVFILSGGTALSAFHLFHRLSDDLDFFSMEPVDELRVHRFVDDISRSMHLKSKDARRVFDRHIFQLTLADDSLLKLEFTHYPYSSLEDPVVIDGVRIDSLRDIAANKLAALLDRFEPKDYYDLYFILRQQRTLPAVRADTERKFGFVIDPVVLGAACTRVERLSILPHLTEPLPPQEVVSFFLSLARSLKDEVVE